MDKEKHTETELNHTLKLLRDSLTGDMVKDMPAREYIHGIEMKLKGVKPDNQDIDCINCGA